MKIKIQTETSSVLPIEVNKIVLKNDTTKSAVLLIVKLKLKNNFSGFQRKVGKQGVPSSCPNSGPVLAVDPENM
jgi:hypothetical protein